VEYFSRQSGEKQALPQDSVMPFIETLWQKHREQQ